MNKHKFSAWLIMPLLVCAATLPTSCGMAYQDSSMIGAGRLDDHTAMAGPAIVSLRFGADWVEVSIANHGGEAIEVDWNALQMGEAYGGVHQLRDMAFLRAASGMRNAEHSAYRPAALLDPVHVRDAAPAAAANIEVIPVAARSVALLYVAEHALTGEPRPGPVFCHSGMLHAGMPHEVWISIPVRVGVRAEILWVRAMVAV